MILHVFVFFSPGITSSGRFGRGFCQTSLPRRLHGTCRNRHELAIFRQELQRSLLSALRRCCCSSYRSRRRSTRCLFGLFLRPGLRVLNHQISFN